MTSPQPSPAPRIDLWRFVRESHSTLPRSTVSNAACGFAGTGVSAERSDLTDRWPVSRAGGHWPSGRARVG
jgi:hypothetical protein